MLLFYTLQFLYFPSWNEILLINSHYLSFQGLKSIHTVVDPHFVNSKDRTYFWFPLEHHGYLSGTTSVQGPRCLISHLPIFERVKLHLELMGFKGRYQSLAELAKGSVKGIKRAVYYYYEGLLNRTFTSMAIHGLANLIVFFCTIYRPTTTCFQPIDYILLWLSELTSSCPGPSPVGPSQPPLPSTAPY